MFLCLKCTISITFLFGDYDFEKVVTLWFHSPTHGNKMNRGNYLNLLSSAKEDKEVRVSQ